MTRLYDAVFGLDGLNALAEVLAETFAADGVVLALQDVRSGRARPIGVAGMEAGAADDLCRELQPARYGALLASGMSSPRNRDVPYRTAPDHPEKDDILTGTVLSIDRLSGFVAFLGSRVIGADLRAVLEVLAPHIERSVSLHLRHEKMEAENSAATFGLDLVSIGVFLLADGSRVARSNRAGRTLLARGDLKIVGDNLVCSDATGGRRLLDAVTERDGRPFALPRASGHPLLMEVHTVPYPTDGGTTGVALARDPMLPALPSIRTLNDLYGLSSTEARLCIAFARAQSVSDFAQEWGLSDTYVKTLSKRALARAGVNTRVELVRLVLGAAF